jgi:flagellar biosynthetic protein FlhB
MSDKPDRDQQTEAATPKRKADAVREGDILQSKELGTALVMLAGAAWLWFAGPHFFQTCIELLRGGLTLSSNDVRNFDPADAVSRQITVIIFGLFAFTIFAAIAGPTMLGSLGFRSGAIAFKASRINPGAGLARIFSMQGLTELIKALVKVTLLGTLGYWLVADDLMRILGMSASNVNSAMTDAGQILNKTVLCLTLGLVVFAFMDVPVQLLRRNARLRMTKQQVKEEMRQSDGAPELKQMIRQRQFEILKGSARKAVAEATVILTNPTHFAIALRYRPGTDSAPVVVARGRGEVAMAIRALANDNGVPILEYPQLTRAIYFTTRAGQFVSEDLFIAVAAILAFVSGLERAMANSVLQPLVVVPNSMHFNEKGRKLAT